MGILAFFRASDQDEPLGEELAGELNGALDAFPVIPAPTILDRAATAVTTIVFDARTEIATLKAEIAEREERLRQAQVIVDTFEPTIQKLDEGYDAKDNGAKCYEVAIAEKRARKAAKPELQAAE